MVPGLVFELAIGRETLQPDQHRADAVLLLGGLARVEDLVDLAVILEAGRDPRINQEPRLPGDIEPGGVGAVVAGRLGKEQVQRVQRPKPRDRAELRLTQRPKEE